ncbi:transposase-like protein [Corynebacterium diphtheriae]|nr:transposase-like protein [Corynebacterium diphtheriae]
MSQDYPIDIFLGLDVGKSEHHACALDHGRQQGFRQTVATTRI